MTGTALRIESLSLETTGGPVEYSLSGPLTVLSGPVGTGKSTLLELIKHAFGGQATISPVAEDNVTTVRVGIRLGYSRYSLSRSISGDRTSVEVLELPNREYVGTFAVESQDGASLSSFLLRELNLPTEARAAPLSKNSTRRPSRVTFNDIYAYLYADQPEIDRSINHHTENYREPKRRTTFDILFGLTDEDLLRARESLQAAEKSLSEAAAEESAVRRFLNEVGASDRQTLVAEQQALENELASEQARLERLRAESDPQDSDVDVVRDLLNATRERLDDVAEEIRELSESIDERDRLAAGIRQDKARLTRVRDASRRLAAIEFVVCPRCSQSIREREVEADACRLCLQPDPSDAVVAEVDSYESRQLQAQEEEIELLQRAARRDETALRERAEELRSHLALLHSRVDERTRELVSPRLQSYADASAAVAKARERLRALDESLRFWDRVGDIELVATSAKQRRAEIEVEIERLGVLLQSRREILDEMGARYQSTVQALGVPGVRSASLDPRRYLPIVDGKLFADISTGGIRTALIVAYWVTLLATAVREAQCEHPTLLVLDSPRKSIGQGEELAENLYRQLDALAEISGDGVQIIVADNGFPLRNASRWREISFTYENPAVPTVPHPGPAKVRTIDQILAEDT